MKRFMLWLALAALLVTAGGCAAGERAGRMAERALDWLLGPEPTPIPTPLPTPTLAPRPSATPRPAQAQATATLVPAAAAGPFEGTFAGAVEADNNTTAPIVVALTQRGDVIAGTVSIGAGLEVVAGGFCGTVSVPAATFDFEESVPAAGREVQTTATVEASGVELLVALAAELSADGETLTAEAIIDTPSLCANDPLLSGTLTRQ
ncbi:MAG: hypothetical protein ACRDHL_09505 [Candidatus Promineifilaceae bacterium]